MKNVRLLLLLGLGCLVLVSDPARALYNPKTGRWLNRDPIGYADGMNPYQYSGSNPVGRVDPLGMWNKDFHHDRTLELAEMAGIACAADVAAGANRPDEDERLAPDSGAIAAGMKVGSGLAPIAGIPGWYISYRLNKEADRRLRQAAEWHFPADKDGVVRPNSAVANAKVDKGIKDCDFTLFSEGLHVLQDSWSHQGKPYMKGLGHARGAKETEVPGHWEKLEGWEAFWSHSADNVKHWPEDARAAAGATFQKMRDFKANCSCACPGANSKTSSGDADKDISAWLNETFPGENKVK